MSDAFDIHPLIITGLVIVAVTGMLAFRVRRQPTLLKFSGPFHKSATIFAMVFGSLLIVLGTLERGQDLKSTSNSEIPAQSSATQGDSCRVTIRVPPMMNNARVFLNEKPLPVLERLDNTIIVKAPRGTEKQKIVVIGQYRQCITFVAIVGDVDIEACL